MANAMHAWLMSWCFFYAPLASVAGLVILAGGKPSWRSVCGTSALWGLAFATVVFIVGFFGAFVWAPESNLAPVMGIFGAPPAFAVGAALGFAFGLMRRPADDHSSTEHPHAKT